MPLFVHSTTRELHPNTLEIIEKVALMIEESGIDAWFELDPKELLGEDAAFYDKITHTMDVWLAQAGRTLRVYGNHPSFALMAPANEPGGSRRDAFLGEWVKHWEKIAYFFGLLAMIWSLILL